MPRLPSRAARPYAQSPFLSYRPPSPERRRRRKAESELAALRRLADVHLGVTGPLGTVAGLRELLDAHRPAFVPLRVVLERLLEDEADLKNGAPCGT